MLEYRQVSEGHPLTIVIFVTQKPAMTSVTSPSPSLPQVSALGQPTYAAWEGSVSLRSIISMLRTRQMKTAEKVTLIWSKLVYLDRQESSGMFMSSYPSNV